MNDQTATHGLPTLSDETADRIEKAVFAEIAAERAPAIVPIDRARARRRRWVTGIGIAAAFAIGVVVTPPILGAVGGGSVMSTADSSSFSGAGTPESVGGAPDRSAEAASDSAVDASGLTPAAADAADSGREIIATANATLRVDDIAKAAAAIAALAEENGGYVETTEIGEAQAMDDTVERVPADSAYGWIGIRVPSSDLPDVITALEESGEVLSSSISRQDVTSVAIDLRARIDATQASVTRLTELMAQSGSVSELIEAEVALTDRQAQLESFEQQLASIDDQVAMSSLQVQLTRTATTTTADPAGFGDGLMAGWNGLIVSLNALVIAVGFILPWVGIAAVVVLVVWLIRRTVRRRRASAARQNAATGS